MVAGDTLRGGVSWTLSTLRIGILPRRTAATHPRSRRSSPRAGHTATRPSPAPFAAARSRSTRPACSRHSQISRLRSSTPPRRPTHESRPVGHARQKYRRSVGRAAVGPDGDASGRRLHRLEERGDRVRSVQGYFDRRTLVEQLGLHVAVNARRERGPSRSAARCIFNRATARNQERSV